MLLYKVAHHTCNFLESSSLSPTLGLHNLPDSVKEYLFHHPEDWHYRHAALMAISAVGEGCEKQMTPILEEVVNAVLPYCQDRVSECVCVCVCMRV